ncbi:membrane protein [Gordonia spumicola]|uniref:Membrane protein n=1 Tax=Gordonia spumicola TaxID=589161 RepID=A0A7I9V3N5_9ACTN|nr:SHOCT domain-containing protein [Gordonia spumicola]GED99771.1 membrane protein [Gordonia spumicola]
MDWSSFWGVLWYTVLVFAFVAYLIVLFQVLTDLFRDHTLGSGAKVLWIIGLIVLPYLTAFVYVVARGKGMTERSRATALAVDKANQEYIRNAAGKASPAEQIATAKSLLDAGVVSQEEYDTLKAKALAS